MTKPFIAFLTTLFLSCIALVANAQLTHATSGTATTGHTGDGLWVLNHAPSFANGNVIPLSACSGNNTSVNALLAVTDSDIAQTETWTVNIPPPNGVLSGFSASAASTGGMVTPTGLTYTPATGFSGLDSFSIRVSDGIASATTIVRITVNPSPPAPAAIIGSASLCTGSTITLTNATPGGSWSAANPAASVSVTGVVTGMSAGTDTIFYTLSLGTCTSFASKTITISPTIAPTIAISSPQNDTICSGLSVTYTAVSASAGSSPSYQWRLNGTVVSTATSYTFTPANHDVVSATVTSSATCASPATAVQSRTVTVTSRATPVVSIISDGGDSVCLGTQLLYYASCTNCGTGPVVYYWSVNNIYYTSGNPFRNTPVDGDSVTATAVSNLQCRARDSATSAPMHMTVIPFITPKVSITGAGGRQVKPGQSDTLVAIVTNGGPTEPYYQWEVNGIEIPGATNRVFIQTLSNYDTVTCIASSSGVCQVSAVSRTIISDGSAGSNFMLFPNPNSGTFKVRGNVNVSDKEVFINIYDAIGRLMYTGKLEAISGVVDEQVVLNGGTPGGVYIACLFATGIRKTIKFTVVR